MDPSAAPPALSVDTSEADHAASAVVIDAAAAVPFASTAPVAEAVPTPDAAVSSAPAAAVSPRASGGKIVILKKRSTLRTSASPTAAAGAPDSPKAAVTISPRSKAAASPASPPLSPTAAAAAASAKAAPSSPAVDHRSYPSVSSVINKIEKQTSLTGPAGATAAAPTATKKYTLARKSTGAQTAAAAAVAATSPAAAPAASSASAASSPASSPTAASSTAPSPAATTPAPAAAPVAAPAPAPVAEPPADSVAPAAAAAAAPAASAAVASSAPSSTTPASVTDSAPAVAATAIVATAAAPSPAQASPQLSPPPAAGIPAAAVASPAEAAPALTLAPAAAPACVNTSTAAAEETAAPSAAPPAPPAAVAAAELPLAAIPSVVVPLTPQKPLASAAAAVSPLPQLVSPGAVAIAVETPLRPSQPLFASSAALEFAPVVPAAAAEPAPASSSRARTPVLLEPLPPLSSSRRGSVDASAAPAFAGSAGLFTDSILGQPPPVHHGHTASNFSMDLPTAGTSRSRRSSLNRSPLPPLHSSTPPPQNLTPRMPGSARTGTPDEPISPSLQAPPGASSRRHGKSPSAVPTSGSRREHLHSRGVSAAPTTAVVSESSPSAAVVMSQSGRTSRLFVGLPRPSTSGALASQLQEVRAAGTMHTAPSLIQAQENASSRSNPRSRLLWSGSACFGLAWLSFALVYALAHPDGGYSAINPAGDRVVLACCVLYALGLGCMTYVAALFWRRVSAYTPASGFLLQLGLTLSMLGLAGLISNQSRKAVLSVLGATPVLLATQAAFIGVCLLFLVFARWVYGSPSRTTQAVLALLEGLDLSTLNRDVRTLKGMNAELIQEHTKLVAKRGMRIGGAASNAAAATMAAQGFAAATGAAAAAGSNEARPLTGHARPGSALLEGNIPAYAVGSYDSPVAGRVVSGASSTRAKDKKRNRSSVGRLNLPADALHSEAALVLSASTNFALPATTARRSSVDGVAMKQMMATNLQLQAKVRDLESQQQGPNWKA